MPSPPPHSSSSSSSSSSRPSLFLLLSLLSLLLGGGGGGAVRPAPGFAVGTVGGLPAHLLLLLPLSLSSVPTANAQGEPPAGEATDEPGEDGSDSAEAAPLTEPEDPEGIIPTPADGEAEAVEVVINPGGEETTAEAAAEGNDPLTEAGDPAPGDGGAVGMADEAEEAEEAPTSDGASEDVDRDEGGPAASAGAAGGNATGEVAHDGGGGGGGGGEDDEEKEEEEEEEEEEADNEDGSPAEGLEDDPLPEDSGMGEAAAEAEAQPDDAGDDIGRGEGGATATVDGAGAPAAASEGEADSPGDRPPGTDSQDMDGGAQAGADSSLIDELRKEVDAVLGGAGSSHEGEKDSEAAGNASGPALSDLYEGLEEEVEALKSLSEQQELMADDIAAFTDFDSKIQAMLERTQDVLAKARETGATKAAADPSSSTSAFRQGELRRALSASNRIRASVVSLQESPKRTCEDAHDEIKRASNGRMTDCKDALRLFRINGQDCTDDLASVALSDYCPVTCGVCIPIAELLKEIGGVRRRLKDVKQLLRSSKSLGALSSSTMLSEFVNDPKKKISELVDEVKAKVEDGTLFKPVVDSFEIVQGLVQNVTARIQAATS